LHGEIVFTSTVLFLCTGNYYRSRFAEVLFNHLAANLGLNWRAVSRGLALEMGADNIGPMSVHAVQRLMSLGIRLDDYLRLPLAVSEADLTGADLIVALKEAEHRPLLQRRFPVWAERVEYWHVHDLDCATALEALPSIERDVLTLASRLVDEAKTTTG
jgi:protein-tyrosine phosphatase